MTTITRGPLRTLRRPRRVWPWMVLLLVAVAFPVGLQFRSGADSSTGSAASIGAGPEVAARSGAAQDGGSAASTPGAAPQQAPAQGASGTDTPVVGPKLARSAWLGIKVSDLMAASGNVRSLTAAAGGQVLSENVVTAPDPTSGPQTGFGANQSMPPVGVDEARLTVRVPAEKLDGLVTELSRIGTVSYRSSQSEDLTDTYVDTSARIGPMRDAVAQARALLAKATSLSQVIQLENEVTRRQADLDSLESRLATLDRRTSTSDVTVSLWTSATPAAPVTTGFVGQLREAWSGLLDSVATLVTGVAVLLPWLVLLLAVTLLARRWWARRPAPARTSVPDPAD